MKPLGNWATQKEAKQRSLIGPQSSQNLRNFRRAKCSP
eukprot:SAG31_NODE_21384_length_551_cov_0.787611_1_plen_37_part_10